MNVTGDYYGYGMAANSIVLDTATTESFYQNIMKYCEFLRIYESTYKNINFPQIEKFETIESFSINDMYSSIALDNQLIHGTFENPLTLEKGEGLFTAAITNGLTMTDPGFDCGYYNVYNITGISAPYGMLNEYEELLRRIVGSIRYGDNFINACSKNQRLSFREQ
ncbi:MAG: hypothetical protein Q4B56_06500 [Erysipelotrichaceae bacterium]|nr:hypothetical protein [Erysipelotrichaceae bacterium]